MTVRPGRGSPLTEDENRDLWQRWQSAKIADADSAEGLDMMLEMAADHQISLTAVWHAVKEWQQGDSPEPVKNRPESPR